MTNHIIQRKDPPTIVHPPSGLPYAVPASSALAEHPSQDYMLLDAMTNNFRRFKDDCNSSIQEAVRQALSKNGIIPPNAAIRINNLSVEVTAGQPEEASRNINSVDNPNPNRILALQSRNVSQGSSTIETVPEPEPIDFSEYKSSGGSCSCEFCSDEEKNIVLKESDLIPKGNGVSGHAANMYFRAVIAANKKIYQGLPMNGSKRLFAQKVQRVLEKHIRFLASTDNNETTRTSKEVLGKVQQALREKETKRNRDTKLQTIQEVNNTRNPAPANKIDDSNDEDKERPQKKAKNTHIHNIQEGGVIDVTTDAQTLNCPTQILDQPSNLAIRNEPIFAPWENDIDVTTTPDVKELFDELSINYSTPSSSSAFSISSSRSNNHSTAYSNSSSIQTFSISSSTSTNTFSISSSTSTSFFSNNHNVSLRQNIPNPFNTSTNSALPTLQSSVSPKQKSTQNVFARRILDNSSGRLDLSRKNISDNDVKEIADALKVNSTLRTLYLNDNKISENGAKEIADALKVNSTLQLLWLSGNGISKEAVKDEKRITIWY